MSDFTFTPSQYVPFRDMEAIERCRKIKFEDMDKHPNPDLKIRIMKGEDIAATFITDLFYRIKMSDERDEKVVLILPNPAPAYKHVAILINRFRVNCRNVHVFAMDEYANEHGEVPPVSWPFGLCNALFRYFYDAIDQELRPPREQIVTPTTKNITSYSKMIQDKGNADACYSGPGWTGHVAFIEPDAPEFEGTLEEWQRMEARICTLSPFTLAQNSLHGSFGMSGDIAALPPKAATIGPVDVVRAKYRMEAHSMSIHNTATTWQRMISRLCLHGPVTPKLPTSIHQLLKTDCYVSDLIAANVEPNWDKGY